MRRVLDFFADAPDPTLRQVGLLEAAEQRRILDEWGDGQVYVLDEALTPVPVRCDR